MNDVVVKQVEELTYYQSEYALPGILFRTAGRQLGVSAWGMNVLDLAPGTTNCPEHDHVEDGQEEVYVLLRGTATLRAGGQEWPLTVGTLARVGPGEKRTLIPGEHGATVLALGGTPGQAYGAKG